MKTRCLLFETAIGGHILEYVHHIYMGMLANPDSSYVIVLPDSFKEIKNSSVFAWPRARHITFDYIEEDTLENIRSCNRLYAALKRVRLLRRFVLRNHVNKVFLISLMAYMPFLPFFLPANTCASGIIYKLYLYEWKSYSYRMKLEEIVKYKLLTLCKCFERVFLLNDEVSVVILNKIYKTGKFTFLPDPHINFIHTPADLRPKLGIPNGNKVFLHFGGLTKRKGTMKILEAISMMPIEERAKMSFIFAGKVLEDINNVFYQFLNDLNNTCNIIVYDRFCDNEQIADLCYTCDAILVPYSNTSQSSGVLGYAAYYSKPVIGPSSGLLGKLIKRYHLGILLPETTSQAIACLLMSFSPYQINSKYSHRIKVEDFLSQISLSI